jgi:peptide-methionine (S)-S-oxide reductase
MLDSIMRRIVMIHRSRVASLGIAFVIALALTGASQSTNQEKNNTESIKTPTDETSASDGKKEKSGAEEKAKSKPKLEKATFGGGCFWCMEAVFERIPGVKSVVSGYAGGNVANPTYQMVCTGLTGHAEVIQIEFDPSVISFDKLLTFFWSAHDPTTPNSQGNDFGTQYRSIILYHDEEQQKIAQKQFRELMAQRGRRSPIVTELVPFNEFYPADAHHQDYFRNHPYEDYSQIVIAPKVRKIVQKLKQKPH